jgi:hypothetical protein
LGSFASIDNVPLQNGPCTKEEWGSSSPFFHRLSAVELFFIVLLP